MFESGSRFSPGLLGRPLRLFAACATLAAVLAAQQPYTVATISTPSAARHSVGVSLAPAADVDLDGSQDLLVGFPYNDNEAGEATSDQIPFPNYAGSSGFHVWSPLTGAFIRTITEPGYATRGFALLNLGDLNGDGKPDAAVSNPSFSQTSGNWVGRVDAYSGADGSVLWSFVSTFPGSQAGASLSRIADVDLDGKPDVLVGASGVNGTTGRVFVISAQTGAVLRTHVGGTGDMLGSSTSDAGDVDGDGTSDYAAGAPQAGVIGTQPAGYVRIWSGATGAVIRTVNGVANFDRFGRALAPAGDLNGDGVPDLYVGAPSRFALTVPGRVYAISGANGSFLLSATRNVPGDRFGWSLAAVGDRNGDGKIDVAAGTAAGVVEVRSGAFGGVLFVQNGLPGQTVMQGLVMRPFAVGDLDGDSLMDVAIGSVNSAENGLLTVFTSSGPQRTLAGDDSHGAVSSIAALGDLDGDGIRDLAISNSQVNTPSANDAGQVVIRSSATGATLGTLSGTLAFEYFGWSVSTLDDVNNDGVEDFLVSSTPTTAGKVTCYSGATGAALYSVVGPTPGGFFGYALARLSDLNGDGIREFAAGAPYSNIAGLATTGQVHVCSGATGAILITVNGLAGGEFFGTPIAEIGDINGDNVADLIVGAAYASPGGVGQAGLARILSGSTGQILRTHSGTVQGIALGRALCGAGDVDLDGVPDYAIGSPANTASGGPAGPVLVHSGATGAVIRTIGPSPVPPGFSVNDTFGVGLSNGGDLDGDGFADLVLGVAPWLGFPPVQAREIHAYSGLNGALISRQVASPGFTPSAPSPAATGFDLTGDGAPDWAAFGYSSTITPAPIAIVSRAGVPAGSTSTGAGCNLAALLPPVLQTGGGALVAAAGTPQFELLVSRAGPNQPGALVVGASNTSWNGTPLPLNLAGFGLPGCLLHNSVDTLLPFVTTPAGLSGFPVPLPANPALAGATAHVQAFLVGAGGTISSSTNGLTLVVQ